MYSDILSFWFGELSGPEDRHPDKIARWWKKDPAFDEEIRIRFGELNKQARAGELDSWVDGSPQHLLAYVVLIDQFSRNLFRNSPDAWSVDNKALAATLAAIEKGWDVQLYPTQQAVLYLPLMHSEDWKMQELSLKHYAALVERAPAALKESLEGNLRFAHLHADIIKRFDRYPHRNEILGRQSSAEELAFLKEENSSF